MLVAESLASFIRASPAVSGLVISGDYVTVSQYADDITIVVSDNASFNGVDECRRVFQRREGLATFLGSVTLDPGFTSRMFQCARAAS